MKKITLVLLLSLFCTIGFAQNAVSLSGISASDFPFEIYTEPGTNMDPCSQSTPSNAFENGHGNLHLLLVANDFSVNPDETFTFEQVTFNILVQPGLTVDGADLYVYMDSGAAGPSVEVYSEFGVVPSSQNVVGTAFGFDVEENVFDFATPTELLGGPAGAVYWIALQIQYSGASSYLEGTSVLNTPNEGYLSQDGGVTWESISSVFVSDPFDGVITVSGDCATLGMNDNILSNVSIFPNPATDILNVKLPSNVEVISADLFDVLGKKTGVSFNNGELNVSGLAKGFYILNIKTSAGTLTEKIIKN